MTTASEPISAPAPPQPAHAAPVPISDVDPGTTATAAPEPPSPVVVEAEPAPDLDPEAAPTPTAEEPVVGAAPEEGPTDELVADAWTHPEGWKYDWLDYRGDNLAVRTPNKSAIHAMGNLRYSSREFQQNLFHRFMQKHVSPESYERVTQRMVDPDDAGYADVDINTDPLYEILSSLLALGRQRVEAEQKALAEVTS